MIHVHKEIIATYSPKSRFVVKTTKKVALTLNPRLFFFHFVKFFLRLDPTVQSNNNTLI